MITIFSIISSSGTGRYSAHLAGELAKYQPVTLVAPAFADHADLLANVRLREIVKIETVKSRLLRILLLIYASFSPIGHFIALRRDSDRLYFANAGHWPQIGVYLSVAKLCGYKTALLIHDVMPHRMLFPAALRGLERTGLRMVYSLADKLVVHHAGAVADLAALGLKRQDRIVVIPHGLFDLPALPARLPGDGLRLLLFGQIRANKNILPAIAAVQALRAQGRNVVLRICGKASAREADYLAACRAAIAARPEGITLEERFVAESELPALVGWCDAFLLPYGEFYSQSGVATLALANGKPIIASKSGGLAELIVDGDNGIEIATDNSREATISEAAIADAIRRAHDIGQTGLAACGERGRARLTASSAWSVVGRLHAAMLDSLRAPVRS